jgi:pyruvate formate lyase activating enzyme
MDKLVTLTDLVMLDIKHIDPEKHLELTAQPNENILDFARYLNEKQVPMWIRHVVVPGLTDNDSRLAQLADYVSNYSVVEKVEILPYHTLGNFKYKELGLNYPLEGVSDLTQERLDNARNIFRKVLKCQVQ